MWSDWNYRMWTNSYHRQSDIQSLLWKGANSSCWGRTQHNGGDSISVGANVYSAGGRLYFVHTFAGGDFIPVYSEGETFYGRFYNATPARDPRRRRRRIPSEGPHGRWRRRAVAGAPADWTYSSACMYNRPAWRRVWRCVLTLQKDRHRIATDASYSDTWQLVLLLQKLKVVTSTQYTVYIAQ